MSALPGPALLVAAGLCRTGSCHAQLAACRVVLLAGAALPDAAAARGSSAAWRQVAAAGAGERQRNEPGALAGRSWSGRSWHGNLELVARNASGGQECSGTAAAAEGHCRGSMVGVQHTGSGRRQWPAAAAAVAPMLGPTPHTHLFLRAACGHSCRLACADAAAAPHSLLCCAAGSPRLRRRLARRVLRPLSLRLPRLLPAPPRRRRRRRYGAGRGAGRGAGLGAGRGLAGLWGLWKGRAMC